jgi:hypothetical protein
MLEGAKAWVDGGSGGSRGEDLERLFAGLFFEGKNCCFTGGFRNFVVYLNGRSWSIRGGLHGECGVLTDINSRAKRCATVWTFILSGYFKLVLQGSLTALDNGNTPLFCNQREPRWKAALWLFTVPTPSAFPTLASRGDLHSNQACSREARY